MLNMRLPESGQYSEQAPSSHASLVDHFVTSQCEDVLHMAPHKSRLV
jgi:hypothetical protein